MANFPPACGSMRSISSLSMMRMPSTPFCSPMALNLRMFSMSWSVKPTTSLPVRLKGTPSSAATRSNSLLPSTAHSALSEPGL